ncbi:hypothetical protein GCM10022243_02300 [Saccharothrix violaceirubra]|uniref:Uncharacterized protein n=1 Tax=Saccharothrix violaceirubra TaxID=413306 RepID=A0A7W7WWH4_9PSEU|nr:hypothetical protein [Saccharothrix violaceirubra]MBB4965987.1 hypothetical protein [Saccharothrix violaceirubra]
MHYQAQAAHKVQLDCERGGWSHLFDSDTGKQGRVANSLLEEPANAA